MTAQLSIDLNCDLGEDAANDEALLPLISSANIACGAHAGDERTMRQTVKLAKSLGVQIGAHPGYADRANFGRVEIAMNAEDIRQLIQSQVELLQSICREESAVLSHIKPHGALYNLSARDESVASAIALAVKQVDSNLILVGLAGSKSISAGLAIGLRTASEIFADRTYQPDGSLTPRSKPNAMISDPRASIRQVLLMIQERKGIATDGTQFPIVPDTLCIHGDGPHAVEIAGLIRAALERENISICALRR